MKEPGFVLPGHLAAAAPPLRSTVTFSLSPRLQTLESPHVMMASAGARTAICGGPLYFFDQPKRHRIKGPSSYLSYFHVTSAVAHCEATQSDQGGEQNDESPEFQTQNPTDESTEDDEPETSPSDAFQDRDPMDVYKRAAPQLLCDLARLLSQHLWSEKGCIPRGINNILNYSWDDLTAGASIHLKSPTEKEKRSKSKGCLKPKNISPTLSSTAKLENRERNQCTEGNVGRSERKARVRSNAPVKEPTDQNSTPAQSATTASFSISGSSCADPGWIIRPKQPSYDEPQWISACQWAVERLQAARHPEKLQTSEQDRSKPVVIRHYGDAKTKTKRDGSKVQPAPLVNGMPHIPEIKLQDSVRQKLHYRIDDGSSFIYYRSGGVAVCQSRSGLPCGGFYTNVFSDGKRPLTLATITASGHGAVSHPHRSAITAVWDQNGGFLYDDDGNITKEWSWQTAGTLKDKIVVKLSDLISVRLFSGVSGVLSFRCGNESVQLPLSSQPNTDYSRKMMEGRFISDVGQHFQHQKTKCSPRVTESERNQKIKPERTMWRGACEQTDGMKGFVQLPREVEGFEEDSALWRKREHGGRELRKLQQRVRDTVEDWLDYYRSAVGIKCPDTERMPEALMRTRHRREALPSLNPPERAGGAKPAGPEQGRRDGFQEVHRQLSASEERPLNCPVQLPRTPKKRASVKHPVVRIGPLQIHGNIKPESVILRGSAKSESSAATHSPEIVAPFASSVPLTVCPALLRAALRGEGRRRRCCCSATLMPAVTDLEYDALIKGQPPHSQQILVVCVAVQGNTGNTHAVQSQKALEDLYRKRNKHRTMPCTQCQTDSFRLLRYEMWAGKAVPGLETGLLQQRHHAAPGMVLMYIRGKLLFVGYIFSDAKCSARDLLKQISRSREDHRLGVSLPSEYKFSVNVNAPEDTKRCHMSSDARR
ncbi:uncharacterized protein ACNS7B_007558 [Menidia menidia]